MRLFLSCSLFLFLLACGTPFQISKKYQKEQINQEVKNPYFSGSEEHFELLLRLMGIHLMEF